MRLSTSPFPFDPTATMADAAAAGGPPAAPGATVPAGSSSFGQLLQAETAPAAVTPGSPVSVSAKAPTAAAAAPSSVVSAAARPRSLFETLAMPAPSDPATIVSGGPGMATDETGDPLLTDELAAEGTPAHAMAVTSTGDAQAELAAMTLWLGSLAGANPSDGTPALEDVQVTVDGQTYAVGTAAGATGQPNATPAGAVSGSTTLASQPPSAEATSPTGRSGRWNEGVTPVATGGERDTSAATGAEPPNPTASTATAALPLDPATRIQAGAAGAGRDRSAATLAGPGGKAGYATPAPADAGSASPRPTEPVTTPTVRSTAPTDARSADQTAVPPAHAMPFALPVQAGRAANAPVGDQGLNAGLLATMPGESAAEGLVTSPDAAVQAAAGAAASMNTSAPLTGARAGTNRPDSAKAKIAARPDGTDAGGLPRARAEQKLSLGSDDGEVASGKRGLGTNTAKTKAPMPAPAPTPAIPTRLNEPSAASGAPLTFDALVKEATSAEPELARAAHRAVDSAMAMADRFSTGAQRGVSLQFSVSGVDLAVRVEMRADGVHTTFRTDSPELRTALAQEWQTVVAAQGADSGQRLVEPVFTASPSGPSTSSDAGTTNHRQPADSQRQQQAAEAAAQRSVPSQSARRAATVVSAAPVPTRPVTLSTVRHLHTFA